MSQSQAALNGGPAPYDDSVPKNNCGFGKGLHGRTTQKENPAWPINDNQECDAAARRPENHHMMLSCDSTKLP